MNGMLPLLETYNESSFPILSIYINVSSNKEKLDEKIERIARRNLSADDLIAVKQNLNYMKGVLQKSTEESGIRSLAFFSGGNKLFEVVRLSERVEEVARVSHSPYLKPIISAQNKFRQYILVLLDRAQAKFFLLNNGVVSKLEKVVGPNVPQKVNADGEETLYGKRGDKIDRHIQSHLNRHFQLIVARLKEFTGTTPIAGIIIGGHKTLFSSFEGLLPSIMKKRVVGEFVTELNTNINEIIPQANDIIKRANGEFSKQHSPYLSDR
jgi:hypothetical protein